MRMHSLYCLDLEKFPLNTFCTMPSTCTAIGEDKANNYLPGSTLKSIDLGWQPDSSIKHAGDTARPQASLFTCLTNASPGNLVTGICRNRRRLSSSIWSLNYEICHPSSTCSLIWLLGPLETTCFCKPYCCRLYAPMVPIFYSPSLLIPASHPDLHQPSQ